MQQNNYYCQLSKANASSVGYKLSIPLSYMQTGPANQPCAKVSAKQNRGLNSTKGPNEAMEAGKLKTVVKSGNAPLDYSEDTSSDSSREADGSGIVSTKFAKCNAA